MKRVYYFLAFIVFMMYACTEKKLDPITPSLGKPGTVKILGQKPVPGGVIVTYEIPNTEDILSVKAVYTLSGGRVFESVASYYENKLAIRGYRDTTEQVAQIYTINRAQEMSDPVTVKFKPLEASFLKTAKTMEIIEDFGGARFSWLNLDKEPLTFEFFTQDSLGRMKATRVINSALDTMKLSLRGYPPLPRVFGCVIRDHWDNATDTIYPPEIITPLLEVKFDKKPMRIMKLGTDANFSNWEGIDEYIIDDNKDTFGHSPNGSVPAAFTVDLAAMVKMSRFVFFNRWFNNSYYSWGNPKTFDVYICNVPTPSSSGVWSEWTKIMSCTQIKPSGSPGTTMTDDDLAAAQAGFEFEMDLDLPPIHYLRFVVTSTWESTSYTHPCELDFYGVYVEE